MSSTSPNPLPEVLSATADQSPPAEAPCDPPTPATSEPGVTPGGRLGMLLFVVVFLLLGLLILGETLVKVLQ